MNTPSIDKYLKNYIRELSGCDTEDFQTLLKIMETNHRLEGPLIMYALFCGYPPKLRESYPSFFAKLDETALNLHENLPLERDCAKVLRSYMTDVINQGGGYFSEKPRIFL